MFTGLTRQEQRTILALVAVVTIGVAVHQMRGESRASELVIDAQTQETLVDHLTTTGEPRTAETGRPPQSAQTHPLVDLNTASLTELTALPGIGEARARAIIGHRETHGPFPTVDSLTGVPGIGPATLERLRSQVTVEGTAAPRPEPRSQPTPLAAVPPPPPEITTSPPPRQAAANVPSTPIAVYPGRVNVNTASLSELMTLPGIGEVLAQRIIDHRHAHGRFRRPEDLLAVDRIGPRTVEHLRPLVDF